MKALEAEFKEFAKIDKRQHGPKCSVCTLPPELLAVIHQGKRDGVEMSLMWRFLRKKGHEIAEHTLARHFRLEHDQAR